MDSMAYSQSFPERIEDTRQNGIEVELPVIDERTLKLMDVRPAFLKLYPMGAELIKSDKDITGCVINGANVTTDSGIGTLEVSFPPQASIHSSCKIIRKLFPMIQGRIAKMGGLMLGYGIQPLTPNNNSIWKTAERTNVFRTNYGEHVNGTTITASNQVHIEVTRKELIPALNVFNALAPVIITLFANSPVWQGKADPLERRAVREALWGEWNIGTEKRTGIPQRFKSISDYLRYLDALRLLAIRDNGRYVAPGVSFSDWMAGHSDIGNGYEMECLLQQEGYVWTCARPRAKYGTIEIRPACSQPQGCEAVLAALCLGIAETVPKVSNIINRYHWKSWQRLYEQAMLAGFNARIENESISNIIKEVLALSENGLSNRGLGEEKYLEPLFSRYEARMAPAEKIMEVFRRKGLEGLVRSTAYQAA